MAEIKAKSEDLLKRLKAGDNNAFGMLLMQESWPVLITIALRDQPTRHREKPDYHFAEDMAAETVRRAFKNHAEGEAPPFKTMQDMHKYVNGILRKLLLEEYRKRNLTKHGGKVTITSIDHSSDDEDASTLNGRGAPRSDHDHPVDKAPSAFEQVQAEDLRNRILGKLLDFRRRLTLDLVIDGATGKEIGQQTGMVPSVVAGDLSRIGDKARMILAQAEHPPALSSGRARRMLHPDVPSRVR